MTVKKLKDLFYNKKEIERLTEEIQSLWESAEPRSPGMSGNPRAPSPSNRLDDLIPEILDKENERNELIAEVKSTEAWINAQIRRDQLVIKYRYKNQMSWKQIAEKIGNGATADSIKHAHFRCLSRK